MVSASVDPITFEVIRNGLDSLVDEMALTVMRTAHSGVVKDAMDYSTCFSDRNGQVISQGLTIALHLGSFPDAIESVLAKYGDSLQPKDMFILNDPYGSGGIHLPDIYVIKPVFVDEQMEGFAGVVAHHTDVGGIVPGSNSTNSTEIFQEGLRIPTLRLYQRGVPNETLFSIIEKNVRLPQKVLGDLRAQIAATTIGEREYQNLANRYGSTTLRHYTDELLNYTERLAREEILDLTDGTYEFTDYIDGDNLDTGPVTIHVKVVIQGDRVVVDLTNSSPQVKAGINSPLPFTKSAVYGSVRLVFDPAIPNSAGLYRTIEVRAPEASVVNPRLPAACGARGITGFRIMDAVQGALAQVVPNRVPSDGEGGNSIVSIGGYDAQGNPFAYVDLYAGARGGRPVGDGPDGVPHPGANISNTPVEIAEAELPIRIEQYGLIEDTGGPGKFRGALSHIRRIRCLADEATLQLRSDKRRFPPYGLHKGKNGKPSWNILNPGEGEVILPALSVGPIRQNEVISTVLASGGGWGDPLERDPDRVCKDVWSEKVSITGARVDYGVVIDVDTLQVDEDATAQLRSEMRQNSTLGSDALDVISQEE